MLLYLLAYVGGALTILSPCILPVLPFVFARAGRPFLTNGLPMLVGMAVMFALVASLAALGGGWAVAANHYGRWVALGLCALFGLALLVPSLSERMTRPLVALGGRLSQRANAPDAGLGASLVLGMATGLLWAPCAGPILGLLLTGAALHGANVGTSLLLLAYAGGAATSLALALVVGGGLFRAMKASLGVGEWVRRGLGAAVLLAVAVMALGLDTGLLTQLSLARTNRVEQGLIARFGLGGPAPVAGGAGPLQALPGAVAWLNSPPLSAQALKGKVVLVDFWTYSCINCLRTLPYVRAWADKYRDAGLVVIGVHAPEFAFEKDLGNVTQAVRRLGITYPVAVDNHYAIWQAFNNQYWPADYLIDGQGRIRDQHFGEGDYEATEQSIQRLLAEARGGASVPGGTVAVAGQGIEAADSGAEQSGETYIGLTRAEHFAATPAAVADAPTDYHVGALPPDGWGLTGRWTVGGEHATLAAAGGGITYRFRARDLHLVMGPGAGGHPLRFRVTIDGRAPGADHGVDTDAQGAGVVDSQRLYQLVRMAGGAGDHVFAITFLDPGVEAFSFTFG